jgi:hypothetical protein
MTKPKYKQLPLFPTYQFRDLYHAMDVWTNHLKGATELSQKTGGREEALEEKGVHILYEYDEDLPIDPEANFALLYVLQNKHIDPVISRIFDRSHTSLFPPQLGSITDFELFCSMYRNNIVYKDQARTDEELVERFRRLPFGFRRELQEMAKKLSVLIGTEKIDPEAI